MSETFTKIGGYIASGDALVYGDANTISGSGTVADPFGVKTQQLFVQAPLFTGTSGEGSATSGYIGCNLSDLIVITEESLGSYNITTQDTNVAGSFSKEGYRPIAWTFKFPYAGLINFNQETTYLDGYTLNIQGYAHAMTGTYNGVTIKTLITWMKV